MDSYVAPTAGITTTGELEVKRSRFITLIRRVTSEDEARAFIQATRAEYPDARHHCSAFIYTVEGANPVERSSDDGEPSARRASRCWMCCGGAACSTSQRWWCGTSAG